VGDSAGVTPPTWEDDAATPRAAPQLYTSVGDSAGVTPPTWEGDAATPRAAPQLYTSVGDSAGVTPPAWESEATSAPATAPRVGDSGVVAPPAWESAATSAPGAVPSVRDSGGGVLVAPQRWGATRRCQRRFTPHPSPCLALGARDVGGCCPPLSVRRIALVQTSIRDRHSAYARRFPKRGRATLNAANHRPHCVGCARSAWGAFPEQGMNTRADA
jgi:hypothetical protein